MKKQVKREASRFVGAIILAAIAIAYIGYRGYPVDPTSAIGAVAFFWLLLLRADQ